MTTGTALDPQVRAWLDVEGYDTEGVEIATLTMTSEVARPTEIALQVVLRDVVSLDPRSLLGRNATLHLAWGDDSGRHCHARVFDVDCTWDDHHHVALYRLRLASRIEALNLHSRVEVHADVSVPDAIRRTLTHAGLVEDIDFRIRLTVAYPKRDLVIQYQETDLAFVTRLCEHWGISFLFEHDGERDVVVFTDAGMSWPEDRRPVPYGGRGLKQAVFEYRTSGRLLPERYILRDYNYRLPRVDLQAEIRFEGGAGGEIVEYGANFANETEGELLAWARTEELASRARLFHGKVARPLLSAGSIFTLADHPQEPDRRLAVYRCEERLTQTTFLSGPGERPTYECAFDAIDGERHFVPERRTRRPRIDGVLHGVIVEREGQAYGQVDDQGCYAVRLLLDRSDARGRPFPVVRLAQPSGGTGYGFHFPLRPGTEVMLAFIEGDPDRPIITGTAPNPGDRTPVALQNHARNVIRTESGNQIDFDDTKGGARIKLDTPFQDTSFQLGSPNGPEAGVLTETSGAISSVASISKSSMTTLSTYWSTWESKNAFITQSKAARPEGWSKIERAKMYYDHVKAGATTVWTAATSVRDKVFSVYDLVQTENDKVAAAKRKEIFEKKESLLERYETAIRTYLAGRMAGATLDLVLDGTYARYKATADADRTAGQHRIVADVEAACAKAPLKEFLAFHVALKEVETATAEHIVACKERVEAILSVPEDGPTKAAQGEAAADGKIAKADIRKKRSGLEAAATALTKAIESHGGGTTATDANAAVRRIVFHEGTWNNSHDYVEDLVTQCDAKRDWARAKRYSDPALAARVGAAKLSEAATGSGEAGERVWAFGAALPTPTALIEKAHEIYEFIETVKGAKSKYSDLKAVYAGGQLVGDSAMLNLAHSAAWFTIKGYDTSKAVPVPNLAGAPVPRAFDAAYGASGANAVNPLTPTGLFGFDAVGKSWEAANIIGSQDATVVGASKRLFMYGPVAVLAGMEVPAWDKAKPPAVDSCFTGGGTVAVLGMDLALVSARKVTEIHASKTVLVSGETINIDGKKEVEIVVGDTGTGAKPHRILIDADRIRIATGTDGKRIEVEAPQGSVVVKAKDVTVETDTLTLDATSSATVKTKAFKVESETFTVASDELKLETGTSILEAKQMRLQTKSLASTATIDMNGKDVSVGASGTLVLTGQAVEVK